MVDQQEATSLSSHISSVVSSGNFPQLWKMNEHDPYLVDLPTKTGDYHIGVKSSS